VTEGLYLAVAIETTQWLNSRRRRVEMTGMTGMGGRSKAAKDSDFGRLVDAERVQHDHVLAPQMIDPKRDRILVRLAAAVTRLGGGLLVAPDETHERPGEGIVVAKGEGRIIDSGDLIPVALEVGDRVLFGRHAGALLDLHALRFIGYSENDQYKIMREDEVMAVVRPATVGELVMQTEIEGQRATFKQSERAIEQTMERVDQGQEEDDDDEYR
jgi:chaperonin GroES